MAVVASSKDVTETEVPGVIELDNTGAAEVKVIEQLMWQLVERPSIADSRHY